jgi:hypothetical protein
MVALVGWAAAVVVAVAVAMATLSAVGDGILGPGSRPVSQHDVSVALRQASASPGSAGSPGQAGSPTAGGPAASPDPAMSPSAPGAGSEKVLTTQGGSIVARCTGAEVTLTSWSPASGYRTDGVEPGPSPAVSVKFKAGRTEIQVEVTCVGGVPTAATSTDH